MPPILQLALDFVDLHRAVNVARLAVPEGVDWVEAGTPLIKSEGLDAVRELKRLFPGQGYRGGHEDHGCRAHRSGGWRGRPGRVVELRVGTATDATISKTPIGAREFCGAEHAVDLIAVADPVERARQVAKLGAGLLLRHVAIDEQMQGRDPFAILLRAVAQAVQVPVGVAGGVDSRDRRGQAVAHGASYVIVGGAITKAKDRGVATREIRRAFDEGTVIPTTLFKRVGAEREIRGVLELVSSANLSRRPAPGRGSWKASGPCFPGARLVGRVLTVRTYPGDWAKPVEAIDQAQPGDVLVIDAGGVGPAIWGELATNSAIQRGLSGVVIDGALRDSGDIAKLGFPAFSRLVMPNTGEPKGFGEIGVPVRVGNRKVESGDWVLGDDDGVVVLPQSLAVEYANRAMDVLEKDNRAGTRPGRQVNRSKACLIMGAMMPSSAGPD